MTDTPDLFKTAPKEVTRFFDTKKSQPTFDWRDIAPEEHAYSWTVAKSAGYDILDDVRTEMDDAIRNRVPFDQFRKQLTPVLQSKGWWGKAKAIDPLDGSSKTVQLGSPRRLKTIYWANTRSAHAAGEWERTQRNKAFLPFLLYTLSVSERRRPEHEGWVGVVLPIDHAFWNTHYPPNGWGCECGVRQISRREAKQLGWSDGQAEPLVVYEPWHNKRTGDVVQVPRGIDPGWNTNPGKARGDNVGRFLTGKLAQMPSDRQALAIEDLVGSPILRSMVDDKMPKAFLPVAQLPIHAIEAVSASTQIVRLSSSSLKHILNDHVDRNLRITDLRTALAIVATPEAIARSYKKTSLTILGVVNGVWWRATVKSTASGSELWLTSFHKVREKRAKAFIERSRDSGDLID